MDNLINFEDNESSCKKTETQRKPSKNPLLVNDRLSFELNNPFDKLEYRITHSDDPFECLETKQEVNCGPNKSEK